MMLMILTGIWGSPEQLTKEQVSIIKDFNNGSPNLKKVITVQGNGVFEEVMGLNENDVYFVELKIIQVGG